MNVRWTKTGSLGQVILCLPCAAALTLSACAPDSAEQSAYSAQEDAKAQGKAVDAKAQGKAEDGKAQGKAEDAKAQKAVDDVTLDLELDERDGKTYLLITLTNTTNEPILVDRELVFMLGISGLTKKGSTVGPSGFGQELPETNWTKEKWEERVTTLHPGEMIARRVDLYGGLKKFFSGGYGMNLDGRMVASYAPNEVTARFLHYEQEKTLVAFLVSYGRGFLPKNRIAEYVGLPEQVERLYGGKGITRCIDLRTGETFGRDGIANLLRKLEEERKREEELGD